MKEKDIRWIQRLANYSKALAQLKKFISKDEFNELEEQGLIQAFEYTHELAWKTLKDFFNHQGNQEIYGSRDATREAFNLNLIQDGEEWMNMIKHRNLTSHTYNEEVTKEIITAIINNYYQEFIKLEQKLIKLSQPKQT